MKKAFLLILLLSILHSLAWAKYRTDLYLSGVNNDDLQSSLQINASDLLSEINRAYFAKDKLKLGELNLSELAAKTLNEMWESKSFYCPEQRIFQVLINRSDEQYEVRGIPIIYDRKSQAALDDEIVIVFNQNSRIVDIKMALDKEKYVKMFEQANTIQDKRLLEIVLNFVENYRTAYNRKDISFIDKVFSNDALIIVGRYLNQKQALPDNLGLNKLSTNKDVSYSRLNKSQYIRNLRSCFLKNSFVRVDFADFRVQRHPLYDYVFGVQMHQKWRSASYNDDGYLFLIINLKEIDEPLIWVRTWQPEKSIKPAEAFELGDFIIE